MGKKRRADLIAELSKILRGPDEHELALEVAQYELEACAMFAARGSAPSVPESLAQLAPADRQLAVGRARERCRGRDALALTACLALLAPAEAEAEANA